MINFDSAEENAYAKINLFLEINARRADGYHDIRTLMHTVGLCDIVRIRIKKGDVTKLSGSSPDIPYDERNTAYKAAKVYFNALSKLREEFTGGLCAEIHITKNIPDGAGLGGGSADAAAVLRGLNRLCSFPFSDRELERFGASVGADVPFLIKGGCALCTGIGDIISPCSKTDDDTVIVLAKPQENISTASAYASIDSEASPILLRTDPDLVIFSVRNGLKPPGINRFEKISERKIPEISSLKSVMMNYGAFSAAMTGSGPCVYGLFKSKSSAEACRTALIEYVNFTAITRFR